ncbi:stage III sporulation protein AG [Parageobacillus thermoglucosidasius]|uniref:Stage III sporulation protein AG n=1 Tax=Parageobacillus thermoglucosidasius TaxID=1426 RepID=A0A1B7KX27_PARTM|nr:stage III sporulation protein AG [Parageobacillus thermoglucosidasius]OAT74616.1 stage III sporulation protein AG [Parageobacillus thermoglucosidasius]
MLDFIKRLFLPEKKETGEQKRTPFSYMFLLLLAGIALMVMSHFAKEEKVVSTNKGKVEEHVQQAEPVFGQKQDAKSKIIAAYEQRYEEQLKTALEAIEGVEDVTVVVNIDTTETKILEKNRVTQHQTTEETDREGGKRKIENQSTNEEVVVIRDGDRETPIVLTTKKPEIRGVLVVAKGADNLQIKKWIVEAVTRVLNVPSYRVAVLPKK